MVLVYTSNDEATSPQVFVVQPETGKTVGTFNLSPSLPGGGDPEAIRLDRRNGVLYLADIGDNDNDRADIALYALPEPGPGIKGALPCSRYPISYPFGSRNAEALAINPKTGLKYILTKEPGGARLMRLPTTLSKSGNMTSQQGILGSKNVTDADFTINGSWLLVLQQDSQWVDVYNALTWKKMTPIKIPAMTKAESISCEPNGKAFLIGQEGVNSMLVRVLLPSQYRGDADSGSPQPGPGPTPGGPCNAATTDPGDVLNLTNWKLTLPSCSGGEPHEIKQPQLKTFESQYFYDMCPKAVVFRAPANGCTTSNSSNPRSELREMKSSGTQEASWNSGSGQHKLDIVQAITHLPTRSDGKAAVVAGQIHGTSDDFTVLRCESRNVFVNRNGKNVLLCNLWMTDGDETNYRLVTNAYELGRFFRLVIVANSGGVTFFYDDYKGGGLKAATKLNKTAPKCYFKAGCYTQANPSNGGKGYGEVRIRALSVTHS